MKRIATVWLVSALLYNCVVRAAMTVTQVAAGTSYGLFVKSDGSLWGMGWDGDGELGDGGGFNSDGVASTARRPEEIISNGVVSAAASINGFSFFVKSDGSLWAMGNNVIGELGDGTYNNTNRPEQVVANGVASVAAGAEFTLFLKSDGSLWGMGANDQGELGDGTFTSTNQPQEIVSSGVVAISAGGVHSLFLKSDGSLWAMGGNESGQLGDGTYNNTNQPEEIVSGDVVAVAAGSDYSLFLKSDGSLWGMGENSYDLMGDGFTETNTPQEIISNGVVAISASSVLDWIVKSDGSLSVRGAWGFESGVEMASNGVVKVSAGYGHALFVKDDGSLWASGFDENGELGDGFADPSSGFYPPEQIFPTPRPVLTGWLSGGSALGFDLQATCPFGGTFNLLASTNPALPLSQWTSVWTSTISYRTNNVFRAGFVINSNAQEYYILQSSQ